MAQALDRLIEESDDEDLVVTQVVRPTSACRRPPIIEASWSEESSSDEEDAASPIGLAARQRVRAVRRHHEEGIERTVRAAQRMVQVKELVEEMASCMPDVDRQLERSAASLDGEVTVDCGVDDATMDEIEH